MSNKDVRRIKSPLDSWLEKENRCDMKRRKIEEIEGSSRGIQYCRYTEEIPQKIGGKKNA